MEGGVRAEASSPPLSPGVDRFIPARPSSLHVSLVEPVGLADAAAGSRGGEREDGQAYSHLLRAELLGVRPPAQSPSAGAGPSSRSAGATPTSPKLLRFRPSATPAPGTPDAPHSPFSLSPVGSDVSSRAGVSPSPSRRRISRTPFKVLDAPALRDDFYLNLVDWSPQNVIAVGLGPCVYLWSASNSRVSKLCDLTGTNSHVCSVAWTQRGTYLAVGTSSGQVSVWDPERAGTVATRTWEHAHSGRVGALSWSSHVLASGSVDQSIGLRDVRAPDAATATLVGHRSEVCGIKWSPDDRELASGGNDNVVHIWGRHSAMPLHRFTEHTAAVKALAWSPHQHGLLASGAGSADRTIRFWNTITGACMSSIDSGSQVCNMLWSKTVNELVTTHGYRNNHIVIWRYPDMSKIATLTAHEMRVLYLAMSPDGQTIVTGAGDETLRFWSVFPGPRQSLSSIDSGLSGMNLAHIR